MINFSVTTKLGKDLKLTKKNVELISLESDLFQSPGKIEIWDGKFWFLPKGGRDMNRKRVFDPKSNSGDWKEIKNIKIETF